MPSSPNRQTTSPSSPSASSPLSARHLFLTLTLTLALPALHLASPRLLRRQTLTDGASCGVEGPDAVAIDKALGPLTFQLRKTGSCVVDYTDVYQIVSYSPTNYDRFDYRLFTMKSLPDSSVEVTIHLSWPKPSASASDRNQYLVYKGYASQADKEEGKPPLITKFVKVSVVEGQEDAGVENYRDPLSSYLMTPPTPIYFLDEESAMANASCVTGNFEFRVKAAARIEGVNPKLSMEIVVYQQTQEGKWESDVAWSDGGDARDDWTEIESAVGTKMTTTSESDDTMVVKVEKPLLDSYFVFNVLVQDELNWYRTGSAHYIAKWVQAECDAGKGSDIDEIWDEIDRNTPATTTEATTIRPNVIVDITDVVVEDDDDDDNISSNNNNNNNNNNSNNNSNEKGNEEEESVNVVPNGDEGIDKQEIGMNSATCLLSVTSTLFWCGLCALWTRL